MRRWILRASVSLVVLVVVACGAAWLIEIFPRYGSHPPLKLAQGMLVIQHARI